MALRNTKPTKLVPFGVTDSIDGTNAPPGSMFSLANLIPDPSTTGVYVPRPAAQQYVSFTTPAAGFVSSALVIGDRVYGTIASVLNPGNDEPYCYDLAAQAFIVVRGIKAANTPAQPPATGAWTPPILAQVGGRVIVTHPGFAGGAVKFGWFDVSGFAETTHGNTHTSTLIDGNPLILGVQPGMTVVGANVPAAATVVSTAIVTLVQTGDTHTSTLIDNLPVSAARAIGQTVAGLGIPTGTIISALTSATSVTISNAATSSTAGTSITFGGATITLSAATTGSTNNVSLAISGGTRASPLWGAGDTDQNNLPSVPVGVAQFNGRAYFACMLDGVLYSDSGFPCRMSLASQALTTNDGLSVTAVGPLLLTAPITGGIVQGLIAFEGSAKMQQITGDAAIPSTSTTIVNGGPSTLAMNALPVATGTDAPLSIQPCNLGLAFVSPQGLRFIEFNGTVTAPIGDAGKGVTTPFINAVQPSRLCLAANDDTLRITTQNGTSGTQPYEEYWYDLTRKVWSGPHSSTASLIQPWRTSFLMSFVGGTGRLYQSPAHPSLTSTYVENNVQLSWGYVTTLLPDSGDDAMVEALQMTLACELATATTATVTCTRDDQVVIGTATIVGDGTLTLWDQFNWDQALWDAQGAVFRQRSIDFASPQVFRQASFGITGISAFNVRVGNLYGKYRQLGYRLAA